MNGMSVSLRTYPFWVDLFNKAFKTWHPARSKMAVLEEHPQTALHCALHHFLRDRTLYASQHRSVILVGYVYHGRGDFQQADS